MNRYQFEVLTYIEKNGKKEYPMRTLSDTLKISGTAISKALDELENEALIKRCEDQMEITERGLEALEPYRVKRAVIMAAGFGSRMVPVTLDRPKPMVAVNGVRIIDTLLDALVSVGIKDITLVRGYKKEKFDEILEKYPFINLIDNDIYDKTNNISSAMAALEHIDQCYLCEADLYISNPAIITKYQYCSNILGSYSLETDDWSFKLDNGYITDYQKAHPDGHNHSGNIHVHIVIGSVRTREVERKPYMQKPRDWREGMKHSSTAQTMRHLRVAVMEMCQDAKLYQIDLLSSKKRVSEREYWMKRRSQMKLDRENAALLAAGQQPTQTEFETAKETLRKQISDVLDNAASFEDFSDRLLQQYGITVKKSRGRLSYLPAGRKKFIRAHSLGDKFEKELVLATLKENAKSQPIILHSNLEEKPDRIKKLVDIQAKLKQGKGIGYERWAKKHNLKAMAQTLILLQEKGLLNEDALDQRIAELDTKFHESLAVVKDLETRMANNQTLRRYAASYKQYRPLAQKRNAAKSPATFEEQHRAELTAYRTAAAYLKANNITKLPSPNKLEAEYCALASEKAQFYEQYKEAKIELLKLKDAKQNVALFFREDERTQHHER